MKIKLAVIVSMLTLWLGGICAASEVDKLIADTKEVIGKHYEGAYQFDFNGDVKKERLQIGTQVLGWRVLAIQPCLTYAPNASNNVVNVELMIPLRLNRFPIGNNRELRDLFPKGKIGGWVDKLSGGFYGKYNVSEGGARFGWRLAFGNND